MPDVSGPGGRLPGPPRLPPTAGLDGLKYRTAAEAALEPESPFVVTYQAYYLLDKIGSTKAEVPPQQIFLGTLVQSVVVVAASLIGGKLSDRTGRRKIFVLTASSAPSSEPSPSCP